jgi:hypothetical protein
MTLVVSVTVLMRDLIDRLSDAVFLVVGSEVTAEGISDPPTRDG